MAIKEVSKFVESLFEVSIRFHLRIRFRVNAFITTGRVQIMAVNLTDDIMRIFQASVKNRNTINPFLPEMYYAT